MNGTHAATQSTDASGTATFTYTLPEHHTTYVFTVRATKYGVEATATTTATPPPPITLTLTLEKDAYKPTETLTATATLKIGDTPLPDAQIVFVIDETRPYTLQTDQDGTATLETPLDMLELGTHTIYCKAPDYDAQSETLTFKLERPSPLEWLKTQGWFVWLAVIAPVAAAIIIIATALTKRRKPKPPEKPEQPATQKQPAFPETPTPPT